MLKVKDDLWIILWKTKKKMIMILFCQQTAEEAALVNETNIRSLHLVVDSNASSDAQSCISNYKAHKQPNKIKISMYTTLEFWI